MNSALFYLFVRNMDRDINTEIHQEVKPYSQITMRTLAKNKEKTIRKLSGIKKCKVCLCIRYKCKYFV